MKMPHRILHINDYPTSAGGGAEVVMSQTIALLRQRGMAVEAFTSADLADKTLTPLRYLDNGLAREALTRKLAAFQPDVVHLHNWYHVLSPGILATLAAYKQRHATRVVMTAHDYHLICPNAGGSWFRWWSGQREEIEAGAPSLWRMLRRRWDERTVFHSCLKAVQHAWNYRWHHRERVIDLVICPSRFVQRMLEPTGLSITWLPHPAPSFSTSKVTSREKELRFVFAGRIEPEKGLNEFLELLPSDFDANLTIIGDGSDKARCQATCVARGLSPRVEFLGRLPHAQTLVEIGRCHVLVQPSRVLETYGLTLIEALAAGTNLLVSDRGAAREIVDDSGVGYLFDIDDADSLATQLQQIRIAHEDGSLNRVAVHEFLETRNEARYLQALFGCYGMSPVVAKTAA